MFLYCIFFGIHGFRNRGQLDSPCPEGPQDGGVGEVALEARHGELGGEVLQDGGAQPEVALRILEVDGVHLCGGGAALAAKKKYSPSNHFECKIHRETGKLAQKSSYFGKWGSTSEKKMIWDIPGTSPIHPKHPNVCFVIKHSILFLHM